MATTVQQSAHVRAESGAATHRHSILAILRKAVRDTRKSTMWLAIGLGLYALFIMGFYSSIADQAEEFDELIQGYPEGFISMFYSGPIEEFSMADPGNYLQIEYVTWMLLIIGAILIGQAFNAITNAERDDSMDMLLSLPVSRRDYLIGRVLSMGVMVLIVLTAAVLALLVSSVFWPAFDVGLGDLMAAIYGMFFPLMVIAGFSTLLAAAVPSSRHFAGSLAYLFMIGSYLLHGFSGSVDQLKDIRPLMLFDYYNAADIIRDGIDVSNFALLGAVGLVYFGLAWWFIDKKELGV